jgi:hypothetical protein
MNNYAKHEEQPRQTKHNHENHGKPRNKAEKPLNNHGNMKHQENHRAIIKTR